MSIDSEIKYRTLIETAPDAIFLVGMESGRVLEINERAAELLGYTESELLDKPIEQLHPAEDVERYLEKFNQTVDRESIQFSKFDDGSQIYLVAKDGRQIPVDICAKVVEGATGPVLFGVARDITDMKQYQAETEQLAEELTVVNRVIRHDIRNDMAIIIGWLKQLKSKLGKQHRETIDMLLTRSESVIELTDTVKDYVDTITGDADPELEAVRVDEIVEQEAAATQQAYDQVRITVSEMPSRPVLANSMLSSIFRNLFHNAVQHNDKAVPTIHVTSEERDGTIVIHVADNGTGIPDEHKSAVFEQGEKLDSSGTGIGLFLIHKLTETYGGAVRIADNDPEGTIMSIELRTVD